MSEIDLQLQVAQLRQENNALRIQNDYLQKMLSELLKAIDEHTDGITTAIRELAK